MTNSTYWVCGEYSLLYQHPDWPWKSIYGVLAGKPWLYGYNPKNGVCCPDVQDLRPATLEDFRFFRVCPVGHLT